MSRIDQLLLAVALAALALGTAAAVVPVRAEAPPVALDRFLIGFERSCNHGPAYRRLVETMMRREGGRFVLTRQTAIPDDIRPAVGRAELRHVEGVAIVTIPVRGTYRGLPVRELRIQRGLEESTVGDGILFDAPLAQVRRALGPMVERSRRGLGEIEELNLEERDGVAQLECFVTN